jgi:SAM-dependent methyltransferase
MGDSAEKAITTEYRELLLGCGHARDKRLVLNGERAFQNLTTVDRNPLAKPDILLDLEFEDLPFDENTFDEVHAYEVLEHIGAQGDAERLLRQFSDYWRVLKPGGLFCATVPDYRGVWAWGDPSHRRVINDGSLAFLNQRNYAIGIGTTPMSDFRDIYTADLEAIKADYHDGLFWFVLRAVKPSRWRKPE